MTLEPHVSIEALIRFRDGELPADEVVSLSRHLAVCVACAALAQELFAGDIEQLGRALGERELARSRRIVSIVLPAAAAAIVIAIALAVLLRPAPSVPPVAHR